MFTLLVVGLDEYASSGELILRPMLSDIPSITDLCKKLINVNIPNLLIREAFSNENKIYVKGCRLSCLIMPVELCYLQSNVVS